MQIEYECRHGRRLGLSLMRVAHLPRRHSVRGPKCPVEIADVIETPAQSYLCNGPPLVDIEREAVCRALQSRSQNEAAG